MEGIRSAAVIGLGLVGGSLARDLAAYGVRVTGYDQDPATVRAARDSGLLAAALGPELDGVEQADLVVLALPVAASVRLLESAHARLSRARLVTDVGSTKTAIVEAAHRLGLGARFVGSHPLAGDHRSGWEASRTGLFRGARVFLCPPVSYQVDTIALAMEMWRAVGAEPQVVAVEWHDEHLAWISHLPQAVSTALALALAAHGVPRGELGPGGRDVTRLAGSSPEMWTDVSLENAALLLRGVDAVGERLGELRQALEARDAAALHRFFAAGSEWAEAE